MGKSIVEAEVDIAVPDGYTSVLATIVGRIKEAQTRAMVSVNRELIEVYRDIGKTLYEQQQNSGWGDAVVEQLAKDLQKSFPGMKGFSSRNLWNMKDFYSSYLGNEKLQTLSAEISWSHKISTFIEVFRSTRAGILHADDEEE
jgi:predicted nuclease of restriction endonuclease-like (RecB) superfamily